MKRVGVLLVILCSVALLFPALAQAAATPLTPAINEPDGLGVDVPTYNVFRDVTVSVAYDGGPICLSSQSGNCSPVAMDDAVRIYVNGTQVLYRESYTQDFGPVDFSGYLQVGQNQVRVQLIDLMGPSRGGSALWLVSQDSGPEPPQKPDVKPRSVWHAQEPWAQTDNTPNHIVIHHTSGDLSNLAARELKLALELCPVCYLVELADPLPMPAHPLDTLSDYDSNYLQIRGSWAGLIKLYQLQHMYVGENWPMGDKFDDIAYHYLIDPDGNIYEGLKGQEAKKGSNVARANTGVVGIAFLGNYQIGEPSQASLESAKKLVDWLAYTYQGNGLELTGKYTIKSESEGGSCQFTSPSACEVDDIAGHRDFPSKVGTAPSECPGDHLYNKLPFLRGQSVQFFDSYPPEHQNSGLLFAMFSPATIGVVDPQGHRLGVDPTTGSFVNEIPNGTYESVALFDDDHQDFLVNVPEPTEGVYHIDVLGTGQGSYVLGVANVDTGTARGFDGTTSVGVLDHYQLIYDPNNPDQLELFHDNEPPVSSLSLDGTIGANGWYTTTVTANLSAIDMPVEGAAGVERIEYSLNNSAWQTYVAPITLTDGTYVLRYRAIDRVENIEGAHTLTIKVDTVPPVVNVWTDQSTYTRVKPFVVHYGAIDPNPGSGIASSTAVLNGQSVQPEQVVDMLWWDLGTYAVRATAVDVAGWETVRQAPFELVANIPSLITTVDRLCTMGEIWYPGGCTSLTQKLRAAQRQLEAGNKIAAGNILQAFIQEITAQSGQGITTRAANILIMDATYSKNHL